MPSRSWWERRRRSFGQVIDDYHWGTPQKIYRAASRPAADVYRPTVRSSAANGTCPFGWSSLPAAAAFIATSAPSNRFSHSTHSHRSIDQVIEEIQRVRQPRADDFFHR